MKQTEPINAVLDFWDGNPETDPASCYYHQFSSCDYCGYK